MDVNLIGQIEMKKFISKQLTVENVDELASIISSNCCNNHYGVFVKCLQANILNMDRTDSWRVLQAFVAGLRSNTNFSK